MFLPLVYHDDYSPPFPADHRCPMEKFRLLYEHLLDSGLTTDARLHRPRRTLRFLALPPLAHRFRIGG